LGAVKSAGDFVMRVFMSWSGDRSKTAALGLKSLLEDTFPEGVDVFISDHIDAGETWGRRLQQELEESQFGILCLTLENFQAPWLLFEAGAIAKTFGSAGDLLQQQTRVVPYLIDELPLAADRSPLAQFQHVQADREGTFRLVKSINAIREHPQADQRLERLFNGWWSDLEQTLRTLPPPAGRQPHARADREFLEEILHKVDFLVQVHRDSMAPLSKLPPEEVSHLLNLRHQPTITYTLHGNLKKELRHLRDLGLIKNKQGPIGQLPATFQLDNYFELSQSGRDQLLRSDGPDRPASINSD
jgi:TIR domain